MVRADNGSISSCLRQLLDVNETETYMMPSDVQHNHGLDEFGYFQDSFVHGGEFDRFLNVRRRIN